jgi:hypothetical protein
MEAMYLVELLMLLFPSLAGPTGGLDVHGTDYGTVNPGAVTARASRRPSRPCAGVADNEMSPDAGTVRAHSNLGGSAMAAPKRSGAKAPKR